MQRSCLLFLVPCVLGCAYPVVPGKAAPARTAVASPVVDACLPTRARGRLIASAGAWRLLAGAEGQGPTLEHVGRRRPSDDELLALRSAVSLEILDPWIFSFGVGACADVPASQSCFTAGVVPGTRPFHVARRLDELFGVQDDDLCYDVRISDAAPVEVFADDGSCLPSGFHGPLRAARGKWRLYEDLSGDAFLLEHVGREQAIDEKTVGALRERVPSAIVKAQPINTFGHGLCGTDIHPRRGVCLMLGLEPGTDPFRGAESIERALGPTATDLCYGVRLIFGTPVFL